VSHVDARRPTFPRRRRGGSTPDRRGRVYTGCIVHAPGPGRVTLYLTHAPEAVLEELEVLHPGVYAIINDAPRTERALREIRETLGLRELRASFLPALQAELDAAFGCGVVRVVKGERIRLQGRAATRAPLRAPASSAR
jgi:hypothetical protein